MALTQRQLLLGIWVVIVVGGLFIGIVLAIVDSEFCRRLGCG